MACAVRATAAFACRAASGGGSADGGDILERRLGGEALWWEGCVPFLLIKCRFCVKIVTNIGAPTGMDYVIEFATSLTSDGLASESMDHIRILQV